MGKAILSKQEMITNMQLVISSTDFLEQEIEKKLMEREVAEAQGRYDRLERIEKEIFELFGKLHRETATIDAHYAECEATVEQVRYEEKKLLSGLCKGHKVSLWGISANSGWLSQSAGIQTEVKAYSTTGLCSEVV